MAFGLEFGGIWGKLALSLFRVGAVIGIGYYLKSLIDKKVGTVVVVAFSLIMAGALGNIIDSAFYGLLFSESYGEVAQFLPAGGGYAGFLQGEVVDMLYFPLFKGYLPDWIPFWGGDYFVFFRPVFNIADTAISTGVGLLILFQKQAFSAAEAEWSRSPFQLGNGFLVSQEKPDFPIHFIISLSFRHTRNRQLVREKLKPTPTPKLEIPRNAGKAKAKANAN